MRLLNTGAAPRDPHYYRQHNSPPPAPSNRVLAGGAREPPTSNRWTVQWSADGEAVAALLDDQPIAFIVAGQQRGYARYIAADAQSWALPWSEETYAEAFLRPLT